MWVIAAMTHPLSYLHYTVAAPSWWCSHTHGVRGCSQAMKLLNGAGWRGPNAPEPPSADLQERHERLRRARGGFKSAGGSPPSQQRSSSHSPADASTAPPTDRCGLAHLPPGGGRERSERVERGASGSREEGVVERRGGEQGLMVENPCDARLGVPLSIGW